MSQDNLPSIVRPARPGSKTGWMTVSGEIPPELGERWRALMDRRGVFQTTLVHEAVELLLKTEERKGRRDGGGRRATDSAA